MFTAGHIEPWLTSHDSDSEVQQRRGLYRISQRICVCVCACLCLRLCGPLWPLLPHIVSKNKIGFCCGLRSVCVSPMVSLCVWGEGWRVFTERSTRLDLELSSSLDASVHLHPPPRQPSAYLCTAAASLAP